MFRLWSMPSFSLPSFPNLALPANIQRRFLSFLLKRTLGHLVKPGQLDINQIESQMGNGWVEIKDIELDQQAINELLDDLPLQLQEGSIGTITARIPLPNIFTAPFSLSLASLHLTFKIRKTRTTAEVPVVNLADSVTSVAESFVHDELSPRETRNLRDSILHPGESEIDEDDLRLPPGSIDPYLQDELRNESRAEDDVTELEGASIFATLVARLLARFSFTAVDTVITVVHEHVAEYTLKIPQVHFVTEENVENSTSEIRTVRVVGLSVTVTDYQHPSASRQLSSGSLPPDPFEPPSDSSSSEDEAPSGMMQSVASLSMYHSAASIAPGSEPSSPVHQTSPIRTSRVTSSSHMETIISSPEPIVARITSSRTSTSGSPLQVPSTPPNPSQTSHFNTYAKGDHRKPAKLSVSVDIGTIAAAIRSRHIQLLSSALNLVASKQTSPVNENNAAIPQTAAESPDIQCRMRGLVLMILLDGTCSPTTLESFFTRPLSQPIETRHIRLQMDKIDLSIAQASLSPPNISANLRAQSSNRAISQTRQLARLTLSELMLFSVSQARNGGTWSASPILIHDPNLPHQYSIDQQSFPTFEVEDWRRGKGINFKPSQWRARIPQSGKRRLPIVSEGNTPFLIVRKEINSTVEADIIECELEPIHIFLDLELVADLTPFIDASTTSIVLDDGEAGLRDLTEDALTEDVRENTPRAGFVGRKEVEDIRTLRQHTEKSSSVNVVLVCPMIRTQIRVPPPPSLRLGSKTKSRSGSMAIDLHALRLVLGDPDSLLQPKRPSARFAPGAESGKPEGKLLAQVEWKRFLLALAGVNEPRASGFISLTSFETPPSDNIYGNNGPDIPLLPRILARSIKPKKSTSVVSQSISLECHIPVVQIFLTKSTADSIQFWADDCAQWAERSLGEAQRSPSETTTANASMIGSQYFAQRQQSLSSFGTDSTTRAYKPVTAPARPSEIAIVVGFSEIGVRLLVSRESDDNTSDGRPFNILASDVDVLVEIRPEGKSETVVSVSVRDAKIVDSLPNDVSQTILELTNPQPLTAAARSLLKLRLLSTVDISTGSKESAVRITASGFTYTVTTELSWIKDLLRFIKAPPGAFESVVPSERTRIWMTIHDGSVHILPPNYSGALAVAIHELEFNTELIGDSSADMTFDVAIVALRLLLIDDARLSGQLEKRDTGKLPSSGLEKWKRLGYALLLELGDMKLRAVLSTAPPSQKIEVEKMKLRVHSCADTLSAVGDFATDIASAFKDENQLIPEPTRPKMTLSKEPPTTSHDLMGSLDHEAFKGRQPELDNAADFLHGIDLPNNVDFIDSSFGATGGLREFTDEEFETVSDPNTEGSEDETVDPQQSVNPSKSKLQKGVISDHYGETIKVLDDGGINIVEGYYDNLANLVSADDPATSKLRLATSVRARNLDVKVHLYDGYDWLATRKVIEDEIRAMRKKLQKIRQLLASGQVPDESVEETHALLFNSVYVGLPRELDPEEMEAGDLIAAIDEQLKREKEDEALETASLSSWQSLAKAGGGGAGHTPSIAGGAQPRSNVNPSPLSKRKALARSKHSRVEFCISGMKAEVDKYHPGENDVSSRILVNVKDLEILDHIKSSTWKKFLTGMKSDSKGNVRETGSNMVRVELRMVKPVNGEDNEEARLRAKFLPLRLHVDQDALDFLKAFFAFSATAKGPSVASPEETAAPPASETYFQHVEVFPIALKLDYKPKRVDYKALKEGKTIELMNFFHFDGAEMTLRHITLNGITGWARLGDTLNDLWTPDVKANQLVDVVSGIAPIRSFVNVGSGFADLVLLPIAQYKKDKRLIRGVQKGTKSFVKTTAMEAIKLGARLATGTQVILEQAENVLGGGNGGEASNGFAGFGGLGEGYVVDRESLINGGMEGSDDEGEHGLRMTVGPDDLLLMDQNEGEAGAAISRYADQPIDVREGMQAAYKSMGRNLNSAAQTILAVPMEVYERSGNEGPVRKVIRAVPIAILRPMIGASEAVSKTLLGLRNTMDPENMKENEEKYKR